MRICITHGASPATWAQKAFRGLNDFGLTRYTALATELKLSRLEKYKTLDMLQICSSIICSQPPPNYPGELFYRSSLSVYPFLFPMKIFAG